MSLAGTVAKTELSDAGDGQLGGTPGVAEGCAVGTLIGADFV